MTAVLQNLVEGENYHLTTNIQNAKLTHFQRWLHVYARLWEALEVGCFQIVTTACGGARETGMMSQEHDDIEPGRHLVFCQIPS